MLLISTAAIVIIVIVAVLAGITIFLYFLGKRIEKKQDAQQAQLDEYKQQVSMLIIDKKHLKLRDSGLPEQVIAQTPWYAKRSKIPIVKAKVGPRIMTFIADDELFDDIPVRKEVKATISGLYILSVKGLHGKIEHTPKKKKGFRARMARKQKDLREEAKAAEKASKK